MDAKLAYYAWLNDANIDMETKEELYAIAGCQKEIYDRFPTNGVWYRRVKGVMGAHQRMNTIQYGLALKHCPVLGCSRARSAGVSWLTIPGTDPGSLLKLPPLFSLEIRFRSLYFAGLPRHHCCHLP